MASISKYGLKFHPNFKLLPSGFGAITLFGHVFMKKDMDSMVSYLDSHRGKVLANHEHWHMLQAESFMPWKKNLGWFLGYVVFYILYIAYWVKNLFKYGFNKTAYYNIPFEQEAYAREDNFNDVNQCTRWKDYR